MDTYSNDGTVSIPEFVAANMSTSVLSGRYDSSRSPVDGDEALLIRQPLLWPGGIQLVKTRITKTEYCQNHIELVPQKCHTFNRDRTK